MNAATMAAKLANAHFYPEAHLLTWFPKGILNNARADEVMDFLEVQESEGEPFHRFTDLSGYTRIQTGLDHIARLARRRQGAYHGLPI